MLRALSSLCALNNLIAAAGILALGHIRGHSKDDRFHERDIEMVLVYVTAAGLSQTFIL